MSPERISHLTTDGQEFLTYLDQWYVDLPVVSWNSLLIDYPSEHTAIISVDVVNGFAKKGSLSSPRIGAIVRPIVELFQAAREQGVLNFLLLQDTHPANSKEFLIYPPHCIEGTNESQTVPELLALPGSERFQILTKKTINPGIEKNFREWLTNHSDLQQFIVVGDCTDICVYLTAIFLKSWQVQEHKNVTVLVPAKCVNTYDIPVERDRPVEVPPHPGELVHALFLYHMQLNGVRIIREIN
jgi:nicotinamidase-related amidase